MDHHREAQAALALHEARTHFFPGARPKHRRETQERTVELKQHMARTGDQARRILCSLSFRAWALTLAEEKRHVAEISCCAGVALVRRSGHAKACERLLTSKQRLETEAGSEGFLAHTRFGASAAGGLQALLVASRSVRADS
ncbi:Uncharacterized protein SCF082_LOCUS13448 [Durusdinium trenchii]|uniref:Uncharacterized protein n=1 Tax=Durusdinium trenchii TaxID=1381693 RepID=A0ABP0JQL2_9DINO